MPFQNNHDFKLPYTIYESMKNRATNYMPSNNKKDLKIKLHRALHSKLVR